jgi:hypothetical protein
MNKTVAINVGGSFYEFLIGPATVKTLSFFNNNGSMAIAELKLKKASSESSFFFEVKKSSMFKGGDLQFHLESGDSILIKSNAPVKLLCSYSTPVSVPVFKRISPMFIKSRSPTGLGSDPGVAETRGYSSNGSPVDDDLSFRSLSDDVGEGIFEVDFIGFFTGAPPITYIDADVVCHGLHKISKTKFTERPEDRPQFASTFSAAMVGYITAVEQIQSLIYPTPNNYEPMFFYDNDTEFLTGYFVEISLIVSISNQTPLNFRWSSAIEGLNTNMLSGQIRITELTEI